MSSELTITYKNNSANILRLIDKANEAGIVACAIAVENEIVKKIESMNIVDTGRYQASITFKTRTEKDNVKKSKYKGDTSNDGVPDVPKKNEAFIGTNVKYAPYLEYGVGGTSISKIMSMKKSGAKKTSLRLPRPAIRQGWDVAKPKLDRIFSAYFKKVFG